MPIIRRRRLAVVALVIASLVFGAAIALASAIGDTERITGYWVGAVLTDDGLYVTEVIDYDFGVEPRHGIYRRIPDADPSSLTAGSPTAPPDASITDFEWAASIRIGDPDVTIVGRHRYRIDYLLPFDAVVRDGLFAWNAIGEEWTVPISNVRIAVAMAADLDPAQCLHGDRWSPDSCTLQSPGSGQYATAIDSVGPGQGVTISGPIRLGDAPDALPVPPSAAISDPGTGILKPFVAATAAAILGGLLAAVFVRRAGRERVWQGGAADAAFGEGDGLASQRLDEKALGELATIEFEPPDAMSAVEGGMLLAERVSDRHLSAWLLESAIRGEIAIEADDDDEITLRRGDARAHPSSQRLLNGMFGSRSEVELAGYDSTFADGWGDLRDELGDWLDGAAHWDPAGRRRRTRAIALGVVGGLFCVGLAVLAAVLAARSGGPAVMALIVVALLVGGAIGTVANASELLVRTEAGSAMWLRVESFRRFLEQSEARHVTEAAERGVVRHYTAWAVALGESKAWTDAVEDAAAGNPELRSTLGRDLAFASAGAGVASAASAAAVAPSSSGGGGGFSGGVGGGGGGGGGGSW